MPKIKKSGVGKNVIVSLFLDIVRKTRLNYAMIIGLSLVTAVTDGLRIASIFLLLPFIGVMQSGEFVDKGQKFAAKLGVEYNMFNVLMLIIGVFILYALVNISLAWFQARQTERYIYIWRKSLMKAYVSARWRFYLDAPAGQLASAISEQCNRLQKAAQKLTESITAYLIMLVYIGMALIADLNTTLILMGMILMLFVVNMAVLGPLAKGSRVIAGGDRRMFLIATEFLSNVKIIKATGRGEAVIQSFDTAIAGIARRLKINSFIPSLLRTINEMLSVIIILVAIAVSIHYGFSKGQDTILLVLALAIRAAARGSAGTMALQTCTGAIAAYETVKQVLHDAKEAVEQDDKQSARLPFIREQHQGDLHFDDVSIFHGETVALDSVSLDIKYGQVVGLVGPSGAGKTTLVDALLCLYPTDKGKIILDGTSIHDFDPVTWRHSIGYVPQEPTLIEGTIRDNLKLLAPDATDEEIELATKRAFAHEFIMEQAEGYDTLVGNMGLKLSGGQRQRIALARALVRPPFILIMDESTSALDSLTEEKIMQAVNNLRGSMILIIIAHRLGTVATSDCIFVLNEGRLVEHGAPDALLAKKGLFFEMWQRQTF